MIQHQRIQKLLFYLNYFNREKITFFAGSLVLVLGVVYPWYNLPSQALKTFGINLNWVISIKCLTSVFCIVGLTLTAFCKNSRGNRLAFLSGLTVALLFPYFIVTWSPGINFLAKSYYEQGQAVSEHIDSHFPEVQAQWKQNISLSESTPVKSIFDFSITDSRFFQLSSWDYFLLNGLGYSNSFFQFIGRGWIFTVAGIAISLIAVYLKLGEESVSAFSKDVINFTPFIVSILGFILVYLLTVNIVNYRLDTIFAKGEYQQVIATSKTLTYWYPPISEDEEFLKRLASAEFYINQPDSALINFIKGLEQYSIKNFQEAENYFQKSLTLQPNRFLVRGYLASAILNQGVNYFNGSNIARPGGAADRFEEAVRIFPDHVEVLYDLMLARVVNGEFEKSARVAQRIIDTQKYFQQPEIGLLGQAYLHLAWDKYNDNNIKQAWQRYRQSIDTSTWKKSVEERQ